MLRLADSPVSAGYPGHHVFNVLLERDLVRGRGFVEFSIYPLFTPQSLIAEGTANYGIQMVFPDTSERCRFEASVLFPLAGLDAGLADTYYRIEDKVQALSYVGNEVTRGLLNGTLTDEQAVDMLSTYALMAPERAAQRLRFIKTYRSYVINYNVGQDLVKDYLAAVAPDERARWETFERLLATPQVPSGLRVDAATSSW